MILNFWFSSSVWKCAIMPCLHHTWDQTQDSHMLSNHSTNWVAPPAPHSFSIIPSLPLPLVVLNYTLGDRQSKQGGWRVPLFVLTDLISMSVSPTLLLRPQSKPQVVMIWQSVAAFGHLVAVFARYGCQLSAFQARETPSSHLAWR